VVVWRIALLLISFSHNFPLLLTAFVLFYPASGAFVSLSQATLMDIEPTRHQQNMARWALAGSVGNVIAPGFVVRSHCIKVGELRFNLGNADGTVVGMLWKSITTPTSSHIDQSMQASKLGFNARSKP